MTTFLYVFYIKLFGLTMLHSKLINPSSIAVIGGSEHIDHIGGSVLKNLIDQPFPGDLFVVNPKKKIVQGIRAFSDVTELPQTDLAIFAIPASEILSSVLELVERKGTKGFMIYSAGFAELNEEGKKMELEITKVIDEAGGSLLGPNNIGMINENFAGIFTRPVPKITKYGADFISASGATAVFTIEAAQQIGLSFSGLYTVGNSAQIGVEEILEYLDISYTPKESSRVKLLYIEGLKHPEKLLKHALSLKKKGCTLVALKAGKTRKGQHAAASHTGAMANPEVFIQALFKKAGIVVCESRYELVTIGAILQPLKSVPKSIGIITHAGGPAVILTDVLTQNNLLVPDLSEEHKNNLASMLYPGAATGNPIDMLATGNADQLREVVKYCENEVKDIDAIAVIFGSPGLGSVKKPYEVIHEMRSQCKKPIFAIMPSVVNVKKEIQFFIEKGNIAFYDEYLFGSCLSRIAGVDFFDSQESAAKKNEFRAVSSLIASEKKGFLAPEACFKVLSVIGIPAAKQHIVRSKSELENCCEVINFPVAQKIIGPLHKTDEKGVILNVRNKQELFENFSSLMKINAAEGVLIQEMVDGKEVFVGAKREEGFPPLIMCGAGGIYVEALNDRTQSLAPIDNIEAGKMIESLRIFPILNGLRGEAPCNLEAFRKSIELVSDLMLQNPQITELDLNPLILNEKGITAVDARIMTE
ncbi:acetate--CoA ligase family protein [Lutimonas saemankumensis]|uniref:acetate--CoA ligase family protein n=1 Tax=Lutimonas saemankumensis TaxID=483016 RepID=UPI001CD48B99|nr:acetate--CoA ligase family protein [Lutimonas saemankumensis]MCA0933774.1 acetate--CoA ligase family protein [Lutimonas saemankumensis]